MKNLNLSDKIKEYEEQLRNLIPMDDYDGGRAAMLRDEIDDLKGSYSEFDEDVFSLEEEPKKMTKSEEDFVENIDKEIETSIVNITRKEVNK